MLFIILRRAPGGDPWKSTFLSGKKERERERFSHLLCAVEQPASTLPFQDTNRSLPLHPRPRPLYFAGSVSEVNALAARKSIGQVRGRCDAESGMKGTSSFEFLAYLFSKHRRANIFVTKIEYISARRWPRGCPSGLHYASNATGFSFDKRSRSFLVVSKSQINDLFITCN